MQSPASVALNSNGDATEKSSLCKKVALTEEQRRAPDQGCLLPGRLRQPPASLVENPGFSAVLGLLGNGYERPAAGLSCTPPSASGITWCNPG